MTGNLKYLLGAIAVAVIATGAFVFLKQTPTPQTPEITTPAPTPAPATTPSPPPTGGLASGGALQTSEPAPADTTAPAAPTVQLDNNCLIPGPEPVVPRASSATADDMKTARAAIQDFVNALEAYQTCREKQIADATSEVSTEQRTVWRQSGNAAVDEAHRLAAAFSAQLKLFKAKSAPAPAATP